MSRKKSLRRQTRDAFCQSFKFSFDVYVWNELSRSYTDRRTLCPSDDNELQHLDEHRWIPTTTMDLGRAVFCQSLPYAGYGSVVEVVKQRREGTSDGLRAFQIRNRVGCRSSS